MSPTTPRHRLCSGLDWNQPSLFHNSPYNQNTAARNDITGFRTFRPFRLALTRASHPPVTLGDTLTRWAHNTGNVKVSWSLTHR